MILKLMKGAVPLYLMPSRKFFANSKIPKMYSEVKARVQKQKQGTRGSVVFRNS